MTNLDVMNMKPGEFAVAYQKVKAMTSKKKPINSSDLSLKTQLKNFKAASFSDKDFLALHRDLISV